MQVSEAELEQYLARELGNYESGRLLSDRVLAKKIVQSLRTSLRRLNAVPATDPIWKGTDGRPTLFKLGDFLRDILRQDPSDEDARWGLVALALERCDNDFGRSYLEEFVRQDPREIRWLVASASWVTEMSGFDTTPLLRESLVRLKTEISSLDHDLRTYAAGPDPYLRRMARVAIAVLQGQSIGLALLSHHFPRRDKPLPRHQVRLIADYGAFPLWGDSGVLKPEALPLRPDTVERLNRWAAIYDGWLDDRDPAASRPGSKVELEAFEREGRSLWEQVQKELGPDYAVWYRSDRDGQWLSPEDTA